MSYQDQEQAFNKVTGWLTEDNFVLVNLRRFPDPKSEVKFYCEVKLLEEREEFVKIIIADQTKDTVLVQATVNFDKHTVNSFNLTPTEFKEQLFQKISARLYQVGVNFVVRPEIGSVLMDKSIFFDSLADKQLFLDNLQDVVKAMIIVNKAITEFTKSIFRDGT